MNNQPKILPMKPVQSSDLALAGYEPVTKTLQIVFHRTPEAIYHYYGVNQGTYESMLAAKSIGSYFHANVRLKYKGVNVTPPK